MVVGVHSLDWRRVRIPLSPRGPIPFRRGEAGAFPNCASVVSRWIPPTERARASSVFWVAVNLASAIAPFIIVGIQKNFGWRPAFYIFGALGVIWAIVWYGVFEDTPRQERGVSSEERKLIGEPALRKTPVQWAHPLRDPNFQLLLLMYHCYCYGAYFFSTWFHTYLQAGRGLTEDEMKFAASHYCPTRSRADSVGWKIRRIFLGSLDRGRPAE
jgi:ACS family glucarate transporter-like MFS transporter